METNSNYHWGQEEFEDLVAKSLIGMYETKIKKHKGSIKSTRLTSEILERVRRIGCYFIPEDRICIVCPTKETEKYDDKTYKCGKIQEIDVINDGRPDFAITSNDPQNEYPHSEDSVLRDAYLDIKYMERISSLPKPFLCKHEGKKYRLVLVWINKNGLVEGICQYVVIDSKGLVYGTYRLSPNYNPITQTCFYEKIAGEGATSDEKKRFEDSNTIIASTTMQFYTDRRFLWNVTAKEGIAKATFGVHPEQIKSLFYARELPMTETGRKRPILHWVASHQRRIKSGIDVDIEKHLRGINEFVYQGTKFIITRPIKQAKY